MAKNKSDKESLVAQALAVLQQADEFIVITKHNQPITLPDDEPEPEPDDDVIDVDEDVWGDEDDKPKKPKPESKKRDPALDKSPIRIHIASESETSVEMIEALFDRYPDIPKTVEKIRHEELQRAAKNKLWLPDSQ